MADTTTHPSINQATGLPLPKYKCHKIVWALKIQSIVAIDNGTCFDGAVITPAEDGYAPFQVSQDYVCRHKPLVGGYYVVYRDGYQSWSPASEFEDGYTKI